MSKTLAPDDLRARVRERDWYHTIDLGAGVVTPGWFDTRAVARAVPLPRELDGRRCLDVGTFDGFWAFEMERRGAAEVLAIDILDPSGWDWPAGSSPATVAGIGARKDGGVGFEIAHRALGSRVQRRESSVYDLDVDTAGRFDVVYVGSLLLHLRDPVGALARVAAVSRGVVVVVDAVDVLLSALSPRRPAARLDAAGRPWWWKPNLAGLARMVSAAGLVAHGRPVPFLMPAGAGHPRPPMTPRTLASRAGRELALASRAGDPHAWIIATAPAP